MDRQPLAVPYFPCNTSYVVALLPNPDNSPSRTPASMEHSSAHDAQLPPAAMPHHNTTQAAPPIYWLRGLPYLASEKDLLTFLANVCPADIRRRDMGYLKSGECSGNAFVELAPNASTTALEDLHNTFFPCKAHMQLPPAERPRPRYVEVLLVDARHRDEQLAVDAAKSLNQASHVRRPRPARGTPSPIYLTPMVAGLATAAPAPAPAPPQQYFLIQAPFQSQPPPLQQQSHHPIASATSFPQEAANSFTSSPRSTAYVSSHSSPRFMELCGSPRQTSSPMLNRGMLMPGQQPLLKHYEQQQQQQQPPFHLPPPLPPAPQQQQQQLQPPLPPQRQPPYTQFFPNAGSGSYSSFHLQRIFP